MDEKQDRKIKLVEVGDILSRRLCFWSCDDSRVVMRDLQNFDKLIIVYFLSIKNEHCQKLLHAYQEKYKALREQNIHVLAICPEPLDQNVGAIKDFSDQLDFDIFLDKDGVMTRGLGNCSWHTIGDVDEVQIKRRCYVVDSLLRVLWVDQPGGPEAHFSTLSLILNDVLPHPPAESIQNQAPVMILPNVFEQQLCDNMCAVYKDTISGQAPSTSDEYRQIMNELIELRVMNRVMKFIVHYMFFNSRYYFERSRIIGPAQWENFSGRVACDAQAQETKTRALTVMSFLNSVPHDGTEIIFPQFNYARYRPRAGDVIAFSSRLYYEVTSPTKGDPHLFVTYIHIPDEEAEKEKANSAQKPGQDGFIPDEIPF